MCPDAYALNENEIVINIRTGKDITAVAIIHADPFEGGATGFAAWDGIAEPMALSRELRYHNIWSITLRPRYKREQYYFRLTDGQETFYLFEDDFYTEEAMNAPGRLRQYYKFPWLNPGDVFAPPAWVGDTIWYQIMPDRFRRGDMGSKRFPLRKWEDPKNIHFWDFYGGDLKGITEKLPYLQELGITGIYMTPIFLSNSNHKYNTFAYDQIDPDFGTEEDLKELVDTAHTLGIRVMLDAVFNHSGPEFAPWQDVVEKGPQSPYWDWFFVNQWPIPKLPLGTRDKFFSFAFTGMMPKLNTNNPEVARYCLDRCRYWVENWNIDGIRFDVGNEVSHSFLKTLNAGLKAVKPDLFLLGEIWHDSLPWLLGDEYDSTMNYPFLECVHNFWMDNQDSRELKYALNRCYSMYPEQVNRVLFNFLDTHDTMRVLNRCGGDKSTFFQQLALLMTLPGSACIYYGTEIALEGGNDPDCRRPMPWQKVDSGECAEDFRATADLIRLRKAYPQLRRGEILWKHFPDVPRLVCYGRRCDEDYVLAVYINADTKPVTVLGDNILFSRGLEGNFLMPGGVAVIRQEVWEWKK
jgi:glycosidase